MSGIGGAEKLKIIGNAVKAIGWESLVLALSSA